MAQFKDIYKLKFSENYNEYFPIGGKEYGNTNSELNDKPSDKLCLHVFLRKDYQHLLNQDGAANLDKLYHDDNNEIGGKLTLCTYVPDEQAIYITLQIEITEFYLKENQPIYKNRTVIDLAHANEISYTKITPSNFEKLLQTWHAIHQNKVPFALIWKDENNTVFTQGFENEKTMNTFIEERTT